MTMTKQEQIEQYEAAEGRYVHSVPDYEHLLDLVEESDMAQHLNRALAAIREEVLDEADRIV